MSLVPNLPKQLSLSIFEHEYYHDVNRPGFFTLGVVKERKWNQRSYKLRHMPEVIRSINPKYDSYITQAEFRKPKRLVVFLWRLPCVFLDLDTYSVTSHWVGEDPKKIAFAILQHCSDERIPFPSVILSSGRGVHVKWFLDDPPPAKALPRWTALERHLATRFITFGADFRATDASRVLRLQGTVNTKTGEVCQVLWPENGEPARYLFDNFCMEVFPKSREEIKEGRQRRQILKEAKQLKLIEGGGKNTRGLRKLPIMQLWWDRIHDLRELAKIRGGVKEGHRDWFLFLATVGMGWVVPSKQVVGEIEALAREFAPGITLNQAKSFTSSAIKRIVAAEEGKTQEYGGKLIDPRYRFTNSWIIETLQITGDEECQMKTIISKTEKRKRDRESVLIQRRAAGMVSRDEYEGKSIAKNKPWEAEGVSRATWYRNRNSKIGETSLSVCIYG